MPKAAVWVAAREWPKPACGSIRVNHCEDRGLRAAPTPDAGRELIEPPAKSPRTQLPHLKSSCYL
jgi:hypothetical protein